MFIMKLLVNITLLLLFSVAAYAVPCKPYKNFYDDRSRGWYWYEEECLPPDNVTDNTTAKKEEPVEKKEEASKESKYRKIPKKLNIPWDDLDELYPSDISKIEEESRQIALMYPTDENVIEYKNFVQWFVMKSEAYMKADARIATTNPETHLYTAGKPTTVWAKDQVIVANIEKTDSLLKYYSDKVGLFVFATETCQYCKAQKEAFDLLAKEYGYSYRFIYLSESQYAVEHLDVRTVPDIFIAMPINGEPVMQRIATGLTTYYDLKRSILKGLGYLGEDIDEASIY